jgi:hypothetical protein
MVVWSEVAIVLVFAKRKERVVWWIPFNCVWVALEDRVEKSSVGKEAWDNSGELGN